jgi:hypothetical protein
LPRTIRFFTLGRFLILPSAETSMKKEIKIVLWVLVAVFAWISVSSFSDGSSDPNTGRVEEAFGRLFGIVFGGAALGFAAALLLGLRWRGWLLVCGAILLPPIALMDWIDTGQFFQSADNQSGRTDFREQPALLAVATAIDRNDEDAIRAAAKKVPDLQAAGLRGKTLLYFAVEQASFRPELVKAVATLLSCGANPNYNNGQWMSFVMLPAMKGDVGLLRTLLEAGGNPNGTDSDGTPIIFRLLDFYPKGDYGDRLRLLLDRGADVNSTRTTGGGAGPLLQSLVLLGEYNPVAYADALDLLKRGADFNRRPQDLWVLGNILAAHRLEWSTKGKAVPPEYEKLCDWLRQHGAILKEG